MRRWIVLAAALALSAPLVAQSSRPPAEFAYRQLSDPAKEAEARALMDEIRCLVCEGQSVADSDAELAGDMRSMIRKRIAEGESPEAVRDWLIERYGNWVTYRPPVEPITWPLYLMPFGLLLLGAWLARGRLKRRK